MSISKRNSKNFAETQKPIPIFIVENSMLNMT